MDINELLKGMAAAVDEAYARGFKAGADAATASILKAAQAVTGSAAAPVEAERVAAPSADSAVDFVANGVLVEAKHKAPRGLTRKVVRNVLAHGVALPVVEIQRRAMEADDRLTAKTIYNELYRSKGYFRDNNGRWRLITPDESADIHAVQLGLTDAPVNEREGQEAPIVH